MSNQLKTIADASRQLSKQAANIEDSAVSEYIKAQVIYLTEKGENLTDYYLIRESGRLTYDGGGTIKQGLYYGLKHKDEVKVVEYPDD